MSAAPEPVAVIGDTVTLTAFLFAIRYLLLWRLGEVRWARVTARWLRRIAAAAVAMPALRLFTMTGDRPEIAGSLVILAGGIVATGLLLLATDEWISARLPAGR